ncbi:MAG: hypothetical protein JWM33_1348, partial [Caulobacteraceae bacterium]|nr:hypothetical protein [Caulobacteraceae bacterium]
MTDGDRVALDKADALVAEGRLTAACRLARQIVVARPDNWRAGLTLLTAVDAANPALAPAGHDLLQRLRPLIDSGHGLDQKDAVRLGRFLFEHHEVQAARAMADYLVATFPGGKYGPIFKYDLELALAQYDDAFAVIERLIEARPGKEGPGLRHLYVKGLMIAGRHQQASAVLDAIKEPDNPARLYVRVAGQIAARAHAEARETGLRLVREFGAVEKPIRRLAVNLAASGGERDAIAVLEEATRRSPRDPLLWEDLAVLLARVGETAAALQANRAAIEIEPSARRLYRRGHCEVALGLLEEADATLTQLAELAPDEVEFYALKAQIQRARGGAKAARKAERRVADLVRLNGTKPIGGSGSQKIIGIIDAHGMGDFTYQAMVLATIKRQFASAHLTAQFNNDAPYKEVVLGFIPELDVVEDGAIQPFRVDVVETTSKSRIFTPGNLSATLLGRFDRTATMRVPADREDRLRAELVAAGANPDRWLMVMHYRQGSTFPLQGSGHRDVSPDTFHAVARHVIETLGGQVLRLGHAGMDAIPDLPGYVDLSNASVELQIYATARARFMLGTDSGPCGYAAGFRTPILKSNSFSEEGAFYPTDILMPKNVVNWRGEVMDLSKVTADRLLEFKSIGL